MLRMVHDNTIILTCESDENRYLLERAVREVRAGLPKLRIEKLTSGNATVQAGGRSAERPFVALRTADHRQAHTVDKWLSNHFKTK